MSPVLPEALDEAPLEPAVPELVDGLAPMVLPLLLGELVEPEALDDGVLAEPEEPAVEPVEPEVDGDAVEPVLEPLAPIDVPLLLGVLADELDVSLEPLLALGVELELEPLGLLAELELLGVLVELELLGLAVELELLGVLLEPDAPIVLVERSFGFVPVEPAGEALVLLEPEPAGAAPEVLLLPELWATAKPPKARAAAAATVVRVVLIMCRTPWFNCPRGGSMGMAPA